MTTIVIFEIHNDGIKSVMDIYEEQNLSFAREEKNYWNSVTGYEAYLYKRNDAGDLVVIY